MPRMSEPVWLIMMSGAVEKNQLCGHFMHELALLMEQASKNQLSFCFIVQNCIIDIDRLDIIGTHMFDICLSL